MDKYGLLVRQASMLGRRGIRSKVSPGCAGWGLTFDQPPVKPGG